MTEQELEAIRARAQGPCRMCGGTGISEDPLKERPTACPVCAKSARPLRADVRALLDEVARLTEQRNVLVATLPNCTRCPRLATKAGERGATTGSGALEYSCDLHARRLDPDHAWAAVVREIERRGTP